MLKGQAYWKNEEKVQFIQTPKNFQENFPQKKYRNLMYIMKLSHLHPRRSIELNQKKLLKLSMKNIRIFPFNQTASTTLLIKHRTLKNK